MTEASVRGGILIGHVFQNGPAQKAGVRRGDIIRDVNGKPTPDLRRLQSTLANYKPGKIVALRILRGDDNVIIRVKLGKRGDILK